MPALIPDISYFRRCSSVPFYVFSTHNYYFTHSTYTCTTQHHLQFTPLAAPLLTISTNPTTTLLPLIPTTHFSLTHSLYTTHATDPNSHINTIFTLPIAHYYRFTTKKLPHTAQQHSNNIQLIIIMNKIYRSPHIIYLDTP